MVVRRLLALISAFVIVRRAKDVVVLIEVDIDLFKLGGSSIGLRYVFRGDDGERLVARTVIVLTDLARGKPVPIPDGMRTALQPYLTES